MSMIDYKLVFSLSQVITADAASTNVLSFDGVQKIGAGEPMSAIIRVVTAADFTSADETYTFQLRTSNTQSAGALTSPRVIGQVTIPATALVVGSEHIIAVPFDNDKYLDMYYDVGGTTPSVTVTTWLGPQFSANTATRRFYPTGYTA